MMTNNTSPATLDPQPPYPGSVQGLVPHAVLPYMGVQFDKIREYSNGRRLRIITYQAFNAYGLIGPEDNGVAVLDEDHHEVVCDQMAKSSRGGYFGVSRQAWELAWRLYSGTWKEVCREINQHPRCRTRLA